MLEPVFIGLLAAAFAFLYGELSRVVSDHADKAGKRIGDQTEVAVELRDKDVYRGVEGMVDFLHDVIVALGYLIGLLVLPLVPYVVSLVFLVVGYGLGNDVVVVVGLVLLCEAFVLCGALLVWIHHMTVKSHEVEAEKARERLMVLVKEGMIKE